MGCGCGNKAAAQAKAPVVPQSELYEVVNAEGRILLRTRDTTARDNKVRATEGSRWRKAGER